ncbi:MAG: HNH endonuclease [Paenibacillus sp.]|nr:HNH endonuclease [Paenibacillus sp.]
MLIDQAIQFVIDEVEIPALEHQLLEDEFKNKVKRSRTVVHRIKKIGDLKRYLQRFETVAAPGDDKRKLYDRFKALNLKTYEDLYPEFIELYEQYFDDVTVLDDFVLGKEYTSWDISIFSQTYDTQSGIYLIGKEPNYQAIFIKATFDGGKYANDWIEKYDVLKYYMYSVNGVFNPNYKYNAAIINSIKTKTPIYVFEKQSTRLTLKGIYSYESDHSELLDGSRWFILNKINSLATNKVITQKEYDEEIGNQVRIARKRNRNERKKHLDDAPKHPETVTVTTTQFLRNSYVIAEALDRAKGICEECRKPAPFLRKDLTPFLEVHHKKPLAEGGEDTIDNAVALCPNCHRASHHAAKVITLTEAIITENGMVLITKCKEDGEMSGKWKFPGGKVENKEILEQCLRKEIKEELGALIRVQKFLGESVQQNSKGVFRIMAFLAKKVGGELKASDHDNLKWVEINALGQFDFHPADHHFVQLLIKSSK